MFQATVCSERINDFLRADELIRQRESPNDQEPSILLDNCFFSWGKEKEHLKDVCCPSHAHTKYPYVLYLQITLDVQKGELHAIVGSFGSGKSSLLSAILGN
ncbi:hypothetical protein TELCIR_24493 [Teladorsagia circumcincta]|nr:hypothetical protein TELCIR_24493 [Teladorsagia circumcincta]